MVNDFIDSLHVNAEAKPLHLTHILERVSYSEY